MTDEEKLAEAERLFVLFDRMAKTGVMKVDNPIRKAQESGRFQELDDAPTPADLERQDAEDEQAAADEMRRWRERGQKAKS